MAEGLNENIQVLGKSKRFGLGGGFLCSATIEQWWC